MPEFFSSDGSLPLQFLVIFAVIVAAMLCGYWLFRRLFARGIALPARSGGRARQPRLGIVDIYELDGRRQLILLRRDNVEHLLLVGGPNDVVVERNVQRGAGSRLPAETVPRPEPASDLPDESGPEGGYGAPPFAMPLVVPPPQADAPEPDRVPAPRLDPALLEPTLPEAAEPRPSAPDAAPAERAEPEPPRRARANPFLRRATPSPVEPRREPVPEWSGPQGEPPVLPAPEPRAVDADTLSDMAQQLETALRRPASAVTPPPRPSADRAEPPPMPAARGAAWDAPQTAPRAAPEPTPPADPIAARMAESQPSPQPLPVQSPTAQAGSAQSGSVTRPRPEEPAGQPAPSPPGPSAPDERKPDPRSGANPFSVEEIEAEFARLLGRPLDKKS